MRIRFIGGPFDGHRQRVERAKLLLRVHLPVSRTILDMVNDLEPVGPQAPATSIAVYDKEAAPVAKDEWRYIFVGAEDARDYKPVKII